MMNFLIEIYENKLLFYGLIFIVIFLIISIILIRRVSKEKIEDSAVDYEKIDGEKSLFDEVAEKDSSIVTNDGKLDLESMIEKMQKDLDAKASEVIEKFETEQEEKSVISYQELIGEKSTSNETISTEINDVLDDLKMTSEINMFDEKDTLNTISIDKIDDDIVYDTYSDEMIPDDEVVVSKLNKKDEFVSAIKNGDYEEEKQEEKGKFKSTEFISPIYGVQDIKIQYPTVQNMKEFKQPARNYNKFELEQTLNMEPLTEEIKRNEDFLKALKEFRKNLE